MRRRSISVAPLLEDKRLSIRVDAVVLRTIKAAMLKEGYGLKDRSKWISNSILSLDKMARQSEEDLLFAFFTYQHSQAEESSDNIQVTLKDEALQATERLRAIALDNNYPQKGSWKIVVLTAIQVKIASLGLAP